MLLVFKCVGIFINPLKFDSQESKVYRFSDSNKLFEFGRLSCIRQSYEQIKGGQTQDIFSYQRIYTHCFIENQI